MKLLKTIISLVSREPEQLEWDGIKVLLKKSPLYPRIRHLRRGSYEKSERDLTRQFIEPGEQILDLGASVGIVTCFLGRQAGPAGRLVCVEADIRLKASSEAHLALNGVHAVWINALCCPLWRDQVPAHIAQQSFQRSEQTLSGRAVLGPTTGESPPWLTALAICQQTELEPTALVMDIEGTEAVWAENPPNFPGSIRLVIAEFHPNKIGLGVAGRAVQAILNEGYIVAGLSGTVFAFQRK